MSNGMSRRPKIEFGAVTFPNKREGSDGDIQLRQTNLGAKLFGKVGGAWYGSALTSTEGTPITRIGTTLSNHLAISPNKLEFMKNSTSMLSITSDGDINMAGKIILVSNAGTSRDNVCIGVGNSNAATGNVAIGVGAGQSLTTQADDNGSHNNVLIGYSAGGSLTGTFGQVLHGKSNVFIGNSAGETSTTGYANVVIGYRAMDTANGGFENVIIGNDAGSHADFEGDNCVFIGNDAGDASTTGDYNICIGDTSDCAAGADKQIAIGYGVACDTAETMRIGDSTAYLFFDFSGSGGAVAVTSDERVKKNIVDTDIGLSFINALRPVKYVPKNKQDYPDELFQDGINPLKDEPRKPDSTIIMEGFIAQEVKQVMDDLGVTFSGWQQNESSRQMLGYSTFVVPLTKAVQELSAKIDTMQTEINNLKAGE